MYWSHLFGVLHAWITCQHYHFLVMCGTIPLFELRLKGDWYVLDWEYDIRPLTKRYGEVSNHMMEWMDPNFEDIKCHVCNPDLPRILKGFVDSHHAMCESAYIDITHKKNLSLPGLDIATLIVPYTCMKHWSVYIVGDQGFVHFNSMIGYVLHSNATIHTHISQGCGQCGEALKSTWWNGREQSH